MMMRLGSRIFKEMPPARICERDGLTIPTPTKHVPETVQTARLRMFIGNCIAQGVLS